MPTLISLDEIVRRCRAEGLRVPEVLAAAPQSSVVAVTRHLMGYPEAVRGLLAEERLDAEDCDALCRLVALATAIHPFSGRPVWWCAVSTSALARSCSIVQSAIAKSTLYNGIAEGSDANNGAAR